MNEKTKSALLLAVLFIAACGSGDMPPMPEETVQPATPSEEPPCEKKWSMVTESTMPRYKIESCYGPLSATTPTELLGIKRNNAFIMDQISGGGCGPYADYAVDVTGNLLGLRVYHRQSIEQEIVPFAKGICASYPYGIRVVFLGLDPGAYTLTLDNYQEKERGLLRRKVTIP